MKPWWQVIEPHKDILRGKLSEAIFAANLGDVAADRGPDEYRDARIFFGKTYITKGIDNLLAGVLTRLNGGGGDPVLQIQTPFGGGKTHSLLSLYHVVKHFDEVKHVESVKNILKETGIKDLKGVGIATFAGTEADAEKGRTPWGEIAHQLGCYDIVKEHDKKRISPGKERLNEILGSHKAVLILIDELLEYVVKANRKEHLEKITQGQTLAFLQELSEAVAVSDRCVLALTLPASVLEQYTEDAEKALAQLQKVSGRVESIYTPVEGVELYEVIRKRLFENVGDKSVHRSVAEKYFDLYQKLGNNAPPEVKEVAYREKIEKAYPFHPELIDVLYEKWGSFPTFQRTRGVLRLLAEVVADLYKKKVSSSLIQSSVVNLGNTAVRREFIKHIGNEYEAVIASDIDSPAAKASQIDRSMGSEYEKYGIAKGIATSVFLYSFSGGERKGVTLPYLRVALLRDDMPHTIVGDAVNRLAEELWYFHSGGNLYSFKNQPNLNRVIVDREESVSDSQIESTLRDLIQRKMIGKEFDTYLWPNNSADVPDNKNLKLAILSQEFTLPSKDTASFINELYTRAGLGFRVYKNALFVIALDASQYPHTTRALKRHLALKDISKDADITEQLTKESQKELDAKLKDSEKSLPFEILTAYRHIAMTGFMGSEGISFEDLGIPTVGGNQTLTGRVKDFLKDRERLLPNITPKYLLDKAFGKDEDEKSVRDIYEVFLKTPGLPLLETMDVVLSAVKSGVGSGLIGMKVDSKVYFNEPAYSISADDIVLKPESARKFKEQEAKGKTVYIEEEGPGGATAGEPAGPRPGIPARGVSKLHLRAKVPWDKIASLISGVIRPLKDKGSDPEIFVEINASSEDGFDRTTLDSKVKETLQQLGANIEDWKEE